MSDGSISRTAGVEIGGIANPITKDNVEEIKGIVTSKRTRDFPVLDEEGKYYGFISSS